MSLLNYPAPVDYAKQLDGFKDFLQHFKTFQSTSEMAATEAMEELNIDGGGTSDEYDFMDDVEDEGRQTRGTRRHREPKLKYMQVLQDIANREKSHILVELDDLEVVGISFCVIHPTIAHETTIVRKSPAGGARPEAGRVHPEEHQALYRGLVAGG